MRTRPTSLLLTLALLLSCARPAEPELDVAVTLRGVGTFSEVTGFGSNPGGLKMFKYVPQSAPQNAPLVLAMHACSQTATDYQKAGWNALADRMGFLVLYPEQQTGNNALRCFNWAGEYGDPTNLSRGEGENQSIIQMIDKMKADHSIDARRIFIMGHSGGGAQTALMLATWPEVFAAGATIAGIPFNCTTTFTQVSTCLSPGINRTPAEWGDRVRAAHTGYSGPYPKLSIWHGTADNTVAQMNATEILEQWSNVQGIDTTPDGSATIDGHTRTEYKNAAGTTLIERWELQGMGHGTPVDPSANCGATGAYFLDVNICAVERIAQFWGLGMVAPPVDMVAPTVNVTAPVHNANVSGTVNIDATAMDNVGVTRVEIAVNGAVKATLTAAPYRYGWNTSTEANGSYHLKATAFDAAGNSTDDDDTTVTVMGGVIDTRPPTVSISSPGENSTVGGLVQVAIDAADDHGVAQVLLLVDGAMVGSAGTAPYVIGWDASNASETSHELKARALDVAGNQAEHIIHVTVTRIVAGLHETFTSPTGDSPGWSFGAFRLDASDHTGTANSKSLAARLGPDGSSEQAVASVPMLVSAGQGALSYQRRLFLHGGSPNAKASLKVVVELAGQSTTVDELAISGEDEKAETGWTGKANLDLSGFEGQMATLSFVLEAEDSDSFRTDARVWLDDITLSAPAPGDTTAPVVHLTAPLDGATVRGLITVKADATDDTRVSVVLLFLGADLIGSDYSAPYEFLWDSNTFPEGANTLTARAFDDAGNISTASANITVVHQAAVEEEPEEEGEPIVAGRRTWGCTSAPGAGDLSTLFIMFVGAALWARRK